MYSSISLIKKSSLKFIKFLISKSNLFMQDLEILSLLTMTSLLEIFGSGCSRTRIIFIPNFSRNIFFSLSFNSLSL